MNIKPIFPPFLSASFKDAHDNNRLEDRSVILIDRPLIKDRLDNSYAFRALNFETILETGEVEQVTTPFGNSYYKDGFALPGDYSSQYID